GTAGASTAAVAGRWGLSAAQGDAAWAALGFLAEPPKGGSAAGGRTGWMRPRWGAAQRSGTSIAPSRFLLWAVTGAGKTEMIFPLLDSVLAVGGRVLVATPRRDVVLELAPRLAKAFSGVRIVTLYGGSAERWESGALTLATTHQLMRFYHAFDLVVIDELDAFPYHNDPMLAYAAQHACKPDGKFVYLSATPPRPLQREVSRGTLPHAKVPVRYHGHPLPVPKRIAMRSVETCLRQPKLLGPLVGELRRSIDRGAQIFLFVSRIRHIGPLVEILRRRFKDISVEGTSSEDSGRGEKVMAFRKKEIRLLVTTTILERGVTVPRSDVYILDADSSLFDEASLVQMAGRAGRSSEDPAGRVIFASSQWTLSQKLAVSQIKAMNRIAGKHGYLKEQPSKS
ncbi:helicase-related protein, partial [Paenibacillus favisporus]|uniref:helicase-related protein n=1 Tax=Paenibacillus favisporus TaxID=221028 RepID=UPI003D2AF902